MQKLNLNSFVFSDNKLKDIKIKSENLKFKQKNSLIFQNNNILIKLIYSQKPADYFRRYFFSQAKREYFGSIKLNKIGISTPKVYGYAFNLNPFSKLDSILFIEYIEGISLYDFFKNEKDQLKREKVLKRFIKDIKRMHNNKIFHKDINFGNVILKDDKLYWIDNDIKYIETKIFKYFEKFKNKTHILFQDELTLIKKSIMEIV